MRTEFRRAILPREIRSLMAFDRKVFSSSDLFDAGTWKVFESYWMVVDHQGGINPRLKGSLYISTTGILPRFRGKGFGTLLKAWEISYARYHGFNCIVTNTRKRNVAMIKLNRKFGFRIIRTTPGYYSDPPDSTVVMELRLR